MSSSTQRAVPLAYGGYHARQVGEPDRFLCEVGRGTPGGEYLRRFWQPLAYESELGEVPLRVRALAEDLVVFRDGGGRVGVLHLHCCLRSHSLEMCWLCLCSRAAHRNVWPILLFRCCWRLLL